MIVKNVYRKAKRIIKKLIHPEPSKTRILSLIKKLRPVPTNKPLIRFGGDDDGGYLLPDDLDGIQACFSPGVGDVSKFEKDCANLGMQIFMADASVEQPTIEHKNFNFIKKFLGQKNSEEFITLKKWIKNYNLHDDDSLLLQMDIEGDEFEVLNATKQRTLSQFRIVIIEFHNLNLLSNAAFFKNANKSFNKLLKNHICVHIHPNNCCGIKDVQGISIPVVAEFTFIRKDRVIPYYDKKNIIPHELDRDNTLNDTIFLPKIWYERN